MSKKIKPANERRKKMRFPLRREMRYKLLDEGRIAAQGCGETLDMASGGVAFRIPDALPLNCYVELAVSWPVPLDDGCRMQLIVFGRVLRFGEGKYVCTIEKWEFRTQARERRDIIPMRVDDHLVRWSEYRRDVAMKAGLAVSA